MPVDLITSPFIVLFSSASRCVGLYRSGTTLYHPIPLYTILERFGGSEVETVGFDVVPSWVNVAASDVEADVDFSAVDGGS